MLNAKPSLLVCLLLLVAAGPASAAENWARFRGPTGQGVSSEKGLPTRWSATENIAWKTAVPGAGWSSPIIHGDRIFLTATMDEGKACHVLCVNRRDGKILWDTEVFQQTPTKKRRDNSYATPTPTTDGERVYAVFSGGSIAALDYDGQIAWTNHEVEFFSQHGLAASPILYKDLLIMPYDGSSDGKDNLVGFKKPWDKAVLLAVDKATGDVRWRGTRGMSRLGHVTPNIVRVNGSDQIVSGAGDVVQGFDPQTGKRIWSVYSQGEGVAPSLVFGEGLVFSCSGFEAPTIRVVKTGGQGDVTSSHIAWEQKKGVPSLASMLYVAPHIYSVTDAGVVTCFTAKTGEIVWQNRIGGKHSCSPVYIDGKIYFLSEAEGEAVIIEAGSEFHVVARNRLDEKCKGSIGVSQGNLFIRSENHLFCIGDRPK